MTKFHTNDDDYGDLDEARAELSKAFALIKKPGSAVDNAVFEFMDKDKARRSKEGRARAMIFLNALAMATITGLDDADEVHPYNKWAFDLFEAVSAMAWFALRDAERAAKLPEGTLKLPRWIDSLQG